MVKKKTSIKVKSDLFKVKSKLVAVNKKSKVTSIGKLKSSHVLK
ncbi:hypothetical protein LCGC14_1923460 [marine sediment metagenome]|uniref:Uncharacterized protein n=1 Tax=marine sediment metagenome TaxID=412755 RepID=A0A0F9IMW4_9ZZZZ